MTFRHSPHPPWSKVERVERGDQPKRKKVAPVHGRLCRIWVQLWIKGMGGVAECHQSMYWMLLFLAKHGTQDRCSKQALSLECAAKKSPSNPCRSGLKSASHLYWDANHNTPFLRNPSSGSKLLWVDLYYHDQFATVVLLGRVECDETLHDSVKQHNDKRWCWAGIAS